MSEFSNEIKPMAASCLLSFQRDFNENHSSISGAYSESAILNIDGEEFIGRDAIQKKMDEISTSFKLDSFDEFTINSVDGEHEITGDVCFSNKEYHGLMVFTHTMCFIYANGSLSVTKQKLQSKS